MTVRYAHKRSASIAAMLTALSCAAFGNPPITEPVSVEVANTPTVVVQDLRERIQGQPSGSYGPGDTYWTAEYGPVEAGKSLTVEFLSVWATHGTAATSGPACRIYVLTEANCNGALAGKVAMSYNIPMGATRDFGDKLELTFASPVQMFVDEGQYLCVRCDVPEDEDTHCSGCGQLRFSGHLTPAD